MEARISEVMTTSSPQGFRLRRVQPGDYHKGYYGLLANLTQTGDVSEALFLSTLQEVSSHADSYYVLVLEELSTERLSAGGTLLIEQKFIRTAGKVGHIEDIVVSPEFQRRGLGKALIEGLSRIAREAGCYKVILDCSSDVVQFYEKCGMTNKGAFMARYF